MDEPDAGPPATTPDPVGRVPRQICGDGIWDSRHSEICDDGNTEDGDGCSSDCSAANCLVPVTHARVQAGVDDASCPVVYVYSGRYVENVAVRRDLTITAVGAERAIVHGGQAGSVLDIRTTRATLQGLTLQGGKAERGGGVYFEGDELTLANMKIHDNTAAGTSQAAGGGIYGLASSLTLLHSNVIGNHVTSAELGRGGGIYSEGARLVLDEASTVVDNRVMVAGNAAVEESIEAQGGGVFVLSGELLVAGGSSVSQNQAHAQAGSAQGPGGPIAAARGGGVALSSASLELAGNGTVHGNRAEAEGAGRAEADGGGVFLEVQTGPSQEDNFLAISVAQAVLIDNRAIARSTGTATGAESIARGGALYVSSRHAEEVSLTIDQESRILDNRAEAQAAQPLASTAQGGGIHAVGHGYPRILVTAEDLMLSGNTVIAAGLAQGGACYFATATHDADLAFALRRSTVSDNRAQATAGVAEGGAIHISAKGTDAFTRVELTNSTLSNNQSVASGGTGRGGGVSIARVSGEVDVTVSFSNVTVADNQATTSGGGLDLTELEQLGASIQMRNTILADNAAPVGPDCATTASEARVSSQGYNLIGTMSDCSVEGGEGSDLIGVISGLGPLAGNSPMKTHALMSYSPAINAGHPDGCMDGEGSLLGTDQCGRERVGRCDIGASEYAPQ